MTKHEFISELQLRLKGIPENELLKSILYYEEMIDDRIEDGMSEEEAVADLGSVQSIADEILSVFSIPALMKAKVADNKNSSSNEGLWLILMIVGFPIWFPLLTAFGAVIFSFYIVVWALIFVLYALLFSFGIGSLATFLAGSVLFFVRPFPTTLLAFGASFCLAALALFMFKPTIFMTKKLSQSTKYFALKIKYLFISKGGRNNENE